MIMSIYGLVLEGGGTKGSYQIGAYKALIDLGIKIGGITGTSIGALNGAMIAQGDYEKAWEIWNNIDYSMIINAKAEDIERLSQLKWDRNDISFLGEKIKSLVAKGGFDIGPFRESLKTYIKEDAIRKSGIDFGIVTINLTELKPVKIFIEDIPKGHLEEYLLASSYVPIFKFERIDGSLYLDGGFFDNLPFGMLEEKGYEKLIIIRTQAKGIRRRVNLKDSKYIKISPNEDLGMMFEFSQERSRYNLKLGYYDALRVFKNLKGNRYYIEANEDSDFYLNCLLNISEEKVRQLEKMLKLPSMPYRRSLFENIIPKIYSIASIDFSNNYEELIIYLLEKKAEKLEIERFKLYEIQELMEKAQEREIEFNQEEENILEQIIDKIDMASFFKKDEFILEIANIIISK